MFQRVHFGEHAHLLSPIPKGAQVHKFARTRTHARIHTLRLQSHVLADQMEEKVISLGCSPISLRDGRFLNILTFISARITRDRIQAPVFSYGMMLCHCMAKRVWIQHQVSTMG